MHDQFHWLPIAYTKWDYGRRKGLTIRWLKWAVQYEISNGNR